MNYLELCQTTQLLLRGTNSKLSQPMSSLVGLEGLELEIASWIPLAWKRIQTSHPEFRFRQRRATLGLNADQRVVDVPNLVMDLDSVRPMAAGDCSPYILVELDGPGDQTPVYYSAYEHFAYSTIDRGNVATGRPLHFTMQPDGQMRLEPTPDAAYTLRFDYIAKPQELVDADDIPSMPERHHETIVWWAIRNYYCTTRAKAGDLRAESDRMLKAQMRELRNDQLPDLVVSS